MVTSNTLLSDLILYCRNILVSNITDPISTTRPSGEKFVMTSFPKRDVHYPILTVTGRVDEARRLGQQSEKMLYKLAIEIRIWARNEKEKNNLFDEINSFIVSNQYPSATSNTSTNETLWDLSLNIMNDIDDPGDQGIKSKIIEYSYIFVG